MDKRIALLCGGTSGERVVSLDSAAAVKSALAKKYEVVSIDTADADWAKQLLSASVDGVFVCLHGGAGENGSIQGFCESVGLPYTGSGVLASAAAMNKVIAKRIVSASGIATPECIVFKEYDAEKLGCAFEQLGGKVVVKPASEGSALGVIVTDDEFEFLRGVEKALTYSSEVLVEKCISGRELTVAVLGRNKPKALPVIEILPANDFYDYESKYIPGMATHICPAGIRKDQEIACQKMAIDAHVSLGCFSTSRTDCILDEDGKVWYLETNTIPGMTGTSLLPDAAKVAGIGFDELCWTLMNDAWLRG